MATPADDGDPGRAYDPSNVRIDPDNTSETDVTEYTKKCIELYEEYNFLDYNLWEMFQEDFGDFTEATFGMIKRHTSSTLRGLLRSRGVWIRHEKRKTIAQSLYATLQEERPTPWTNQEIQEHMATKGDFLSRVITSNLTRGSNPPNPPTPHSARYQQMSPPPQSLPAGPQATAPPAPPLAPTAPIQAPQAPETPPAGDRSYGKELANLAKMYTEENKYGGNGDNFDFKLTIFHDLCDRADVPDVAKAKAFPTMLKDLAIDFFYANNATQRNSSFEVMCDSIRAYFEGPEYKRGILTRWNETSLKSVMDSNDGKTTTDCLQLLVTTLRHLQHGLDPSLRTDVFIHNKIITACQEVPACQYACYKPSPTIAGLLNDLRSSIVTWEKSHKEQLETSAFYTDRRYYKRPGSRPSNSNYRDRRRLIPRPRSSNNTRTKRCFVCGKEGCMSFNHTKKEREESKAKFKQRFTQRFDSRFHQYLTEFEGVEGTEVEGDDEEDDVFDEFEALMVTVEGHEDEQPPQPLQGDSTAYITCAGTMTSNDAAQVSVALADHSFGHFFTKEAGDNSTSSTDNDPFAYTSTATRSNRYTSTTFYGVMIDSGASKKSTAGYSQYIAYQETQDTPAAMDLSTKGSVSVQFGIGATDSIGSIHMPTPLGNVEFHIVDVDTPFLLCLADMDRLGVYYNNVTTALISSCQSYPVVRRFGHAFWLWNDPLRVFLID